MADKLKIVLSLERQLTPKGKSSLDLDFNPPYQPPYKHSVILNFNELSEEQVDKHKVNLSFGGNRQDANVNYFVSVLGFESGLFGDHALKNAAQGVFAQGINYPVFTSKPSVKNGATYISASGIQNPTLTPPKIFNHKTIVKPLGFDSLRISNPKLVNVNQKVTVSGFNAESFTKPTIYNLRKYVTVNGINSLSFGLIYLQGGVRYLNLTGINALAFGAVKAVNTRADQTIKIGGISAPSFPRPNVSPQILTARGFLGTLWGSPYVQRNPSPNGWISERFGTAWVSRSPRFYTVGVGEVTQFGSAKIFDAKQKVTVTGVIPGGIFGDIAIRNLNFKILPTSIAAPEITHWTNVENTSRYYTLKGFNSAAFGQSNIRNATPSFKPDSIDSAVFGRTLVADRIRRLNTSGFDLMRFGQPIVTKTPQLSPRSIDSIALGVPTLTLYTRYLVTTGGLMMAMGQPFIAPAKRQYKIQSFDALSLGAPTLSHGVRNLLARGLDHSALGYEHRVWFRVRSIAPEPIFTEHLQYGHRVGGSQHVAPRGFDASLFGHRIVPESQAIFTVNFKSSEFGVATLRINKAFLSVTGFATGGQQPADRWGRAKVYNLRQYITQTYDVDSDLNPPKMGWWTSIVNRNRTVGITGSNTNIFGRASIQNKATLMLPKEISAQPLGIAFISHRIRSIELEGIEPPYISGWTNLHNTAAVIKPKSFDSSLFGKPAAVSNRRYFPRIGNFESMVFGEPMISFKIRKLSIESRYSIGPISFPIHKVQLYTRYLEVRSNDFAVVGQPSLAIHKKIITPRWYLKDLFGDVNLRNVTPEVKTRGRNAEEFGQAAIRTQWREVQAFGDNAQLFGKPVIAFRDRAISVNGFIGGSIGSALRVRGTASPPLSKQYIYVNGNIGPTYLDIPNPRLHTNVIRPESFVAAKFGDTDIYSNGILVDNGIKLVKECGTPTVQLSRRKIEVEGINNLIAVGKPAMSPHTIYAVVEAPQQAQDNHNKDKNILLHYINSDRGTRTAGEVFGTARVWMHNPYLNPESVRPRNQYGTAIVQLKRRYIDVKGIQAYRFGWHKAGDGTQDIIHRQPLDFSAMGRPTIVLAKDKLTQVKPSGLSPLAISSPRIEFYHRTIKVSGINSLAMGSSRGLGSMYMPQSLHVGFPMPIKPVGSLMEKFGTTYIGLKVREILVQGFDSFVMEYDALNFDKRMRVQCGQGGADTKPVQTIQAVGFDAAELGVFNIRLGVHYIRPYGNADHYRKGAF